MMKPTNVRHPLMGPTEDLSKALALLGLEALPRDPAELSRLVTHRYPATAVWNAEQSWAYRVVWNRCTPAASNAEHRPGQR
jgi:hypothetical protein